MKRLLKKIHVSRILVTISLTLSLLCSFYTKALSPSFQRAEYAKANTILLHQPGNELGVAMFHPSAALFDCYFSIENSQKEHQNYVSELQKLGIHTVLVKDLLIKGCVDAKHQTINTPETEQLRNLALRILKYDTSALSSKSKEEQEQYKREVITSLSADELVNILLMQPTLKLLATKNNTGISADYSINPLMNLFYTRDQSITTPKGVVICKMNSPQRQNECEIIKFCLAKMNIKPIFEVTGNGAFLEGGDYLLTEKHSFIGCGMRTTQVAIDKMLQNQVFGTETVIVVKDKRFYQAEMHLDTYFNIIDKDLVTFSQERMTAPSDSKLHSYADIYTLKGDKYVLTKKNIDFVKYLINDLKMNIIPISSQDQKKFANNHLTVAPRKIMAVAGQSETYKALLRKYNVDVTWLPLDNIIKGFGAAHCMTQVIYRE